MGQRFFEGNEVAIKSLEPSLFNIPVEEIKRGFYSDKYFFRTKEILEADGHHPWVTMQVFAKKEAVLCGVEEVLAILRLCADRPEELEVKTLRDGDIIHPWESVMHIEGDYATYAHLETLYLGVLARRTAVATSVRKVVEAGQGKQVLFFSGRFDHYLQQPGDGYAAFVGGAHGVSTDANASFWQLEGIGTIPHGLIAAYGGDTVKASVAFDRYMPKEVLRIVLVDFDNDSVNTSLKVARALGRRLWGVRLDTAEDIRDYSVEPTARPCLGVCPQLVCKVREALDREGFDHVKIVVSGGFDEEKVRFFIEQGVPFDSVGIGSSLLRLRVDFTADVVRVEGIPCSKVGRLYSDNPRFQKVTFT